jgi:hypothetical protein
MPVFIFIKKVTKTSRGEDITIHFEKLPKENFILEPEWDYKNDFAWNLTGTQLAASFKELKNLLNSYDLYKNSIVMGPSVGTDAPYNLTDPARQVLQESVFV